MRRARAVLVLCLALSIPALASAQDERAAEGPAPIEGEDIEEIEGLEGLPPWVVEKLDPETLAEIIEMREARHFAHGLFGELPGGIDVVGLAAVLSFFFAPVLFLLVLSALQYRKHRDLQQTLRLMIEKGAEIPPELLAPPSRPHRDLRWGLVLLGLGLGVVLLIGLTAGFGNGAWAAGLIPAFIGAGFLVVWQLSRRGESR